MNDTVILEKPTLVHVPNTDIAFTAHLFHEQESWSLKALRDATPEGRRIRERLGATLGPYGASDIFAPSPVDFNGKIIAPDELYKFPFNAGGNVRIYRGNTSADITWLEEGHQAYAFSGGGCPLVVVYMGGFLFACHGGRDSVLDRGRVETMGAEPRRECEGIIASICERVKPNEKQLQRAQVWVFWSIPHMAFDHDPKHADYGQYNSNLPKYIAKRWGEYGSRSIRTVGGVYYFDLPLLIKAQCATIGIPKANVHIDADKKAYLPRGFPHTRLQGPKRNHRSLAVIIRRP